MGAPGLWIEVTNEGGLRVAGELDLATAGRLEISIDDLVHDGRRVVLDLGDLEFIDSTGIRVLIKAAKSSGQPLLLRNPARQVRQVLDIALPRVQAAGVWEVRTTSP